MALLLFLLEDRAQSGPHCNALTEGNSVVSQRKWNDPVSAIMADVGAAAVSDASAAAPLLDDRGLVRCEIRVVGKHVGDPAEPDAPHFPDRHARGHMEHRPVDPVQ